MVFLNTCNEVMFLTSVLPSRMRRFEFKVSCLCDDNISAGTFVMKGSRQRAMTAPSPCFQRTAVFKDLHNFDCLPRVGWRFTAGDGYRSKEPINVSRGLSSY
jgi:hypothetical protein